MTKIISIKEWDPATFDEKINALLAAGYEIQSIITGVEGNTDGSDIVFASVLKKEGTE